MIKNLIKQVYLLFCGWKKVKCLDGSIIWFSPWDLFWEEEYHCLDDAVWHQGFIRNHLDRNHFLLRWTE